MSSPHPSLLLLGVGGGGATLARGILRAFGLGIRTLIIDTDAKTGGNGDVPFTLLGGNRLAGRGTGGQPAFARAAFQDNPDLLDTALEGVRTVVIVTSLGGGTGGGATGEILKHLHSLGIVTLIFATMPFAFEGDERRRAASTAAGPIEQNADVSVFLPLDDLVAEDGTDNMREALAHALETIAAGVTLFWRVIEKPGYIRFDSERLRGMLSACGRGHFATAVAQGPDRVQHVLAAIAANRLLARSESSPPVRSILVGVLAGDDLRLSEINMIVCGLTAAFGADASIELGTVNDEDTFSGRLAAVVLVFEQSAAARPAPISADGAARKTRGEHAALAGNGRFQRAEKTMWNDEDLDIPTYIRRSLSLDR
ncbi:MAG: hypothetical protein IJ658_01430 [Kiritimatiellae bacterium]|nr:hypothetical protein [Kiritimatiellia bacterium]